MIEASSKSGIETLGEKLGKSVENWRSIFRN